MGFTLVRRQGLIARLIAENIPELHREAVALFEANGLDTRGLGPECAAFILWSVHVGIVNARTSELDRWIAERLLEKQVSRIAKREGDAGLDALYRLRCGQVLATTRNIFLYRSGEGDLPALPVTLAGARLFVRQATGGRGALPAAALASLLELLKAHFWSCVKPLEPLPRAAFP
ncbi:MAG TPA: hypothetical protein VGE84_07570 [Allosphingosinicella sp.]